MYNVIAILDAGSQFTKLIDRRIRELNVKTEVLQLSTSAEVISKNSYKAIVISGGPGSVNDSLQLKYDPMIFDLDIPILGICYGMQLIVKHFGGVVESSNVGRQDGQIEVEIDTDSALYNGIQNGVKAKVLLTHGDVCTVIPEEFSVDAKSNNSVCCGLSHRDKKKNLFGVQFHPEVDLTSISDTIWQNFVFKISGCEPLYTLETRLEETLSYIREFVNSCKDKHKIVCLVSGGVDSLVCSALLKKATTTFEDIYYIHIGTGFMRQNESLKVKDQLEKLGVDLKVYELEHEFLNATTLLPRVINCGSPSVNGKCFNGMEVPLDNCNLFETSTVMKDEFEGVKIKDKIGPLCDITDPEEKRKIIGDMFISASKSIMAELGLDPERTVIVQGTLRPDLIESASSTVSLNAEKIKTHHNDSPVVRLLREKGLVFEPLKNMHKDEVRRIGHELGLPDLLLNRHPFPGPGLAIRILCNSIRDELDTSENESNQKLLNYISNYHEKVANKRSSSTFDSLKKELSEFELENLKNITDENYGDKSLSCHILPIKTVGVQGDGRSYKNCAVLSCEDFPNWVKMMELSKFITKMCPTINRVVYSFGNRIKDKVIGKMTPCHLTPNIVKLLREADEIVNEILRTSGYLRAVNQFPVVLIPVQFDNDRYDECSSTKFSIVFRPVISIDFMTCLPAVPDNHVPLCVFQQMCDAIHDKLPRISRILYDLTGKPPGTIEWE